MSPQTLYQKIWHDHVIKDLGGGYNLIYVDRHLVHEVTSPQAFEGLRLSNRRVRRPELTLAVCDHNIPTRNRDHPIEDLDSRTQVETIQKNCKDFGITYYGMHDRRQGIVHVIGPEQGFTLPGLVIVCGDSHTATHGAFGSLAFGIGTSEVEHVLATQSLVQKVAKNMRVSITGGLAPGVGAKDIILAIIDKIGTAGGTGYVIEYTGDTIRSLNMEERMTICNMSIEAGARAGMIAPDETTFRYLKGRPMAPSGDEWDQAIAYWKTLSSDEGAVFDQEIHIDATKIAPLVTWGTSPEDVVNVDGNVPSPNDISDQERKRAMEMALAYMGLEPGTAIKDIAIDKVFIGSCTNGRLHDLRSAAQIIKGKKVAEGVQAIVVPGSGLVKAQAEAEGLNLLFQEAGFEWRDPGCSMCLGMNDDRLNPLERCATTSNRNFEGRQGKGGRSHLMSPAMAALAAVTGRISDIRSVI